MKINNPSNFLQNQGFTINQKNTSKTIFQGYSSQTAVKSMADFSFETVEITRLTALTQTKIFGFDGLTPEQQQQFTQSDPALSNLTRENSQALISDDGYYGVAKTSQRIADFVLNGSGDDLDRLKQGREGVLQSIGAAEKDWGGKLPDISYATIEKAIKSIDDRISELGGNVVNVLT